MDASKKKGARYSRTLSTIWTDEDFIGLTGSSQRRYWMLYSQSNISLCGIVAYTPGRWSQLCAGDSHESLERDLVELEVGEFIVRDLKTDELLIRTFVRHDVALESGLAVVGMSNAYATIHSKDLRKVVMEELRKVLDVDLWERLQRKVPDGENRPLRERVSSSFLSDWETF